MLVYNVVAVDTGSTVLRTISATRVPKLQIPPLKLWPRVAFTAIVAVICTVVEAPIMVLIDRLGLRGRFNWRMGQLWARIVGFAMGLKVTMIGTEWLTPGQGFVLAPNHQGYADVVGLLANLPVPFRWVAKEAL